MTVDGGSLHEALRAAAVPLEAGAGRWDRLLDRIGGASIVLIGEATHGTDEFYRYRAEITQRLVEERGFRVVALEADWPDAYRANRYVHGRGRDRSAGQALGDFTRFPRWMWRNVVVAEFVEWLREHNARRLPHDQTGFYGLDLYSLYASVQAVLTYLDRVDPSAAERARARYGCFDHDDSDPRAYGYAASLEVSGGCEDEAVEQLLDLRRHAASYLRHDGMSDEDEHFFAEQNARLVKNAERYYRAMFRGGTSTWNLRDQHMVESLNALRDHLSRRAGPVRTVVWAHNSHLGDARASERARFGEINVGQLLREQLGRDCFSIGFTTHRGTVCAASRWDGPGEIKQVRPALPGSYEWLFHRVEYPEFWLALDQDAPRGLASPRLERAIGVIYLPETERFSHYIETNLPARFDAVIHVDDTRALEPLDRPGRQGDERVPETYPHGV